MMNRKSLMISTMLMSAMGVGVGWNWECVGGGQALALESVNGGTIYLWSTEYVDISDLTNYTSKDTAATDYASCENSAKIRAQGTSSTYPAVWAAREYKTVGTEAGDWCLPAAGIFTSYYNNKVL